MIIKAHGHTDLNHSLSFQRVQCVSDIKGPSILFTTWKKPSPPTHIYHCRSDPELLERTVNQKLSFHPPFFHNLGFPGIYRICLFNQSISVYIRGSSPTLQSMWLFSTNIWSYHHGKITRDESHLSCPQGPMYTIVILTWYSAWKYFLLLEKQLSFGASTADIKSVDAFLRPVMRPPWKHSEKRF